MNEYLVPAAFAETELVEKRSRFIGHVWPVETEEEARAYIEQMKKKYHDARHNCWCYRLKEGGVERYSDDGEPQGTAGQPMLGVFQKEGILNVVCVVTRYFGGILLGAGGLVRAYTQSAKDTLDAAGIAAMRLWRCLSVPVPYSLYERVKNLAAAHGGVLENEDFGADVTLHLLLPDKNYPDFAEKLRDLSAGSVLAADEGTRFTDIRID